MFVPSLSWQNDRFYITHPVAVNVPFSRFSNAVWPRAGETNPVRVCGGAGGGGCAGG
eukprot:COSAG06_NODE_37643_length_432_cov_5.492492_1_plen_56_part_01